MKTNTFIIPGLNSFQLTSLKRELRYFKESTPVKITYRFKKIYIHIREDQRYCVLLNILHRFINPSDPMVKLITNKQGYQFLSDYFGYDVTPPQTQNTNK